MRIIAGRLKGRRVSTKALGVALKKGVLRPTSSKVREAVFNILGGRIKDAIFIDLYAGTGAVGMEAMSRGAGMVYFVEANKRRADAIEELLKGCGCNAKANIVRKKASLFLMSAVSEGIKADIIFLDPPYYSGELENALHLLEDGSLLKQDGLVMAEHLSKTKLPSRTGMLLEEKTYRYGDTGLTLYRKGQ